LNGIKGSFYVSEEEYAAPSTFHEKGKSSEMMIYTNDDISKSVKKEALILLPSLKALIRVDRLGVIDHVISASQRGATVKIICPLSEENSKVTAKINEQASAGGRL
jgi:hypothetical protein